MVAHLVVQKVGADDAEAGFLHVEQVRRDLQRVGELGFQQMVSLGAISEPASPSVPRF